MSMAQQPARRRTAQQRCVDISAQTYKPNCPPAALTKLPLTATPAMVCKLVGLVEGVLEGKEAEA